MKYPIAIMADADGAATVHVPDVPGCVVVASTEEEAVRRAPAAVTVHLEAALQSGDRLPPPKEIEDHMASGRYGDAARWETIEIPSVQRFSPRDFMRARRPDLYSDSVIEREPVVDVAFLDFALAQVTERKDEIAFEHFCRRLAEKEICPNLITQTGPTGGGDSKVDTETLPVAEAVAERWYIGDPKRASSERWAFAFSAKQDWRSKVRDDVKKIAETGRGYTVAYFMTNQQVPDRTRGHLEDELRERWNLDIRILDRNWIADRVLTGAHLALFESTLHVNLDGAMSRRVGRADAERERDLTELDAQIDDPERYVGVGHQLAEDCLETALLARGLDRPRIEVDGRFDRAERVARDHGSKRQLLRITCHRAWTASYWYEDIPEFERLYESAAALGIGTDNVWDLERLTILWQVGVGLQRMVGGAPEADALWTKRTAQLRAAVKTIANDGGRPTSSLMGRTLLALIALTVDPARESLVLRLSEIGSILESARDHLDYPFESMARIVEELVNLAGGEEDLDELLDKTIEMQAERVGDVQGGRMRLQRALVCLKGKRYREAIGQAGKAQLLLGRGGADEEFLRSLIATACAYEAMGLLWAARANYAFALHWVLRASDKTGELPAALYAPLSRLIWAEIELGRVPQALCWLELDRQTSSVADDLPQELAERLAEERTMMDAILAIVVLRTPWPDLPRLDRAPGVLEALDLPMSRFAAMFLLGYEAAVTAETGIDEPEGFFAKLIAQPAGGDVAEHAEWGIRWPFSLRTVLFGCQIEVLIQQGLASLLLGETVLAFVESFLATSGIARGRLMARAELRVIVVTKDGAKQPFEIELDDDDAGEVNIVVAHAGKPVKVADGSFVTAMVELLAHVLGQLWMPLPKGDLEALFAEERAQDRASLTAQLPVVFRALLGHDAKVDAKAWMELGSESLALCRTAPWRPQPSPHSDDGASDGIGVSGNRPASGIDGARHRDMKVVSVLNLPLWDAARWRGLFFPFPRHADDVPEMHLLFENIDAGRKIFRGWLRKFGASDPEENIGLTLVTGVDRKHPHWYRLVVGCRDPDMLKSNAQVLGLSAKIQEMSPPDGRNLGAFLSRFRRLGRYRIAPLELPKDRSPVHAAAHPGITVEKRSLRIVPAWKIGPDDFLRMAVPGVKNPVVPREEKDPPFYRRPTDGPVVFNARDDSD